MREDNIEEKFDEFIPMLKNRELYHADQDVINAVCYSKMYALPFKYNVRNVFPITAPNSYRKYIKFYKCTKKEWKEAKKHPIIIHYNSSKKPWKYSSVQFGNIWWEYARKTNYLKEIQQKYDFEK